MSKEYTHSDCKGIELNFNIQKNGYILKNDNLPTI